ncbi:hypothetical protein D3C87_2030640 [compost metagenome]
MQQVDLPSRAGNHWPLHRQPAALAKLVIDTPFTVKFRRIQTARHPVLAEVFGGIEADAAGTDNRHALADRLFIA